MTAGPPRVFAGVPCARFVDAAAINSHLEWLMRHPPDQMLLLPPTLNAIPGRIDMSRSVMWDQAKSWKADWHIQVDSDTTIRTPVGLALRYCEENRRAGYDVTIWPTKDVNNQLMVRPVDPNAEEILAKNGWTKTFGGRAIAEVTGGAFGGVVFSKRALDILKPLAQMPLIVSQEGLKEINLYMESTHRSTEDFHLCERLRDAGIRICADPRVLIGHLKWHYVMAQYETSVTDPAHPDQKVDPRLVDAARYWAEVKRA